MDILAQSTSLYIHQNSGHDTFQHHSKRLTKLKKGAHRKERLEVKLINQRIKEKGKGKGIFRELVGRSGTNSSTSIGVTSISPASPTFPSLIYPTSATQSGSRTSSSISTISAYTSTSSSLASTSLLSLDSSNYSTLTSPNPNIPSLSISLLVPAPTSLKIFQSIKRPLKAAVAVDRGEILVETGSSISNLAAAVDVAGGGGTLGSALSQAIATQYSTQGLVDVQQIPSSTLNIVQETSSTPALSTIFVGASSIPILSITSTSIPTASIASIASISSIPSTLSSSALSIVLSGSSTAPFPTSSILPTTSSIAPPTTSISSSSSDSSASTPTIPLIKIVPATLGSIFVLGLLILVSIILIRRRRRQKEQDIRRERRQQFRQQVVSRGSWRPTRPDRPVEGSEFGAGESGSIRSFGNGANMSGLRERDEQNAIEGEEGDMSEVNIGNLNEIGLALGGADMSEGLVQEAQTPWGKRSLRAVLGRGGRGSAAIYGSSSDGGRAKSMEKYRFDHSRGSSIDRGTGGYNSHGGYQPPISPDLPSPPLPEFPLPSIPPSTRTHTPPIVDNLNIAPEEFRPVSFQFSDAATTSNLGHLLPPGVISTGDNFRPVSYQFSDAPSNIDSPRDSLRQLAHQDSFFGASTERAPGVERESSTWTIDRENSDLLAPKYRDATLGRVISRREQEEGIREDERVDFGSSSEGSEGAREFERREATMKLEGTQREEEGEEIDPSRRVMKDDGSWW